MAKKPYDQTFVEYPKMVWDPKPPHKHMTVKNEAEIPEGWTPHHPNDPERAPTVAEDDDQGSSRKEVGLGVDTPDRDAIIAMLRERGTTFNPRAPTAALAKLLMD